jgi:DNA-binding transcriptional regulator YdaS (Cro superfamily)
VFVETYTQTPFGDVLEVRRRQGNATDIARELGVSYVTVWRWAKGVRPIPGEHVDKLAVLLDVPRERLEAS